MHLHPGQTWKWPSYGCGFPADTLPSCHPCYTPAPKEEHESKLLVFFHRSLQEKSSCSENILATHIEHAKLRPVDLVLPRAGACGPAMVFADLPLAFTSVCPLVTITHLLPWGGIWVDTAFEEENQFHRSVQVVLYLWIPDTLGNSTFKWNTVVPSISFWPLISVWDGKLLAGVLNTY